jgi:hypothetical protein
MLRVELSLRRGRKAVMMAVRYEREEGDEGGEIEEDVGVRWTKF